jgi:DNA-binding beta-propeller fold protein YncE
MPIRRIALGAALALSVTVCPVQAETNASPITARISVPGHPFRIAAGKRYLWVLSRGARGACPSGECGVLRVDPETNRVVGRPTSLPADGWDLVAAAGSVWVTQFDGRLVRIDGRTGRIRARIRAPRLYFGSTVAFGGGYVWTGNDDERNRRQTVTRIDPATNRIAGRPLVVARPSSPQSIAFGGGALWVADHAGWLVKVHPRTFRVVARRRLAFGPHGVAATARAVYVADAHAHRLLEADPATGRTRRVRRLAVGPIYPVLGAGSVWASSSGPWAGERDDRVLRIDPRTLRLVTAIHVGGSVPSVTFGFGSVWAADVDGDVVRIAPGPRAPGASGPRTLVDRAPASQGRVGSLILFWSKNPYPSLWSLRPDGTHRRRVLRVRQNAKRPSLSPDRKWILFDGAPPGGAPLRDFDVQIVRRDGTGRRLLTNSDARELDAQWSPDGSRISYSRLEASAEGDWRKSWIWTVRPDGTDARPLVLGNSARWSSDGKQLVFSAPTGRSDGDLFVIGADGTGLRRLLSTARPEWPSAWSPDGRTILFSRSFGDGRSDVFTIGADGHDVRRLTHAPGENVGATWSPRGDRIVFASTRQGLAYSHLFRMRANGTRERAISFGDDYDPVWR